MKPTYKTILSFITILLVIIACTKQVGLYTEVEFELAETHESEGYVNTALTTVITVTPEELVEGYSYSYSYKINSGAGYFEDESGIIISEGEKTALNPLSASLNYIATEIGDHSIVFTAEDSFGFTEQVIATYLITDIPVTWIVSASIDQILLGDSETITVVLGSETEDEEVTYQRNYSFTEGTGTLTTSEGDNEILNELVDIIPGTYVLDFTATEIGTITIQFLLKDSNGEEFIELVSFEAFDIPGTISSEKEITSFSINDVLGTITDTTIDIELPEGTDLTTLSPTIVHTGETISPTSGVAQDFTDPVVYTVTAEDNTTQEYTVTCTVEEAIIVLTNIEVTPNPVNIEVDETEQLNATITPNDATNQTVTWSSSDTSIAIVDSSTGEVTGILEGDAIITATSENGVSGTTEVNVSQAEVAVTNVEISPNPVSLEVGETEQLSAIITPTDATNETVTWSSSDTSIATVAESTGLVTGISEGDAIITATTENGVSGTTEVNVSETEVAVTNIEVTPNPVSLEVGETEQLSATITPTDATNQTVNWSSSNTSIATVDSSTGEITGILEGDAIITATSENGVLGTTEVSVNEAEVAVISIEITPDPLSIEVNETEQLSATITPTDATNQTVTWSSDDESIATVDSSTGLVTGISEGDAIITANVGGQIDTVTITVTSPIPTAIFSDGNYVDFYSSSVLGTLTIINGSIAFELAVYAQSSDIAQVSDISSVSFNIYDEDGAVIISSASGLSTGGTEYDETELIPEGVYTYTIIGNFGTEAGYGRVSSID